MMAPDEPRPVDEWPPPTDQTQLELSNKDGTSSRLLFLTVQYVGEEPSAASFNTGLESFPELEQRVVSPLDPNMGCTACYSPVYRPTSPLMPAPVSPTSGYLNPSSPPSSEAGMIVLSEQITNQLSGTENFVVTAGGRIYSQDQVTAPDEGKLLLLTPNTAQAAELVVAAGESCGDQRVELLLSNGTIAYGIVESGDVNGTKVIQIPREYLVAARHQSADIPTENTTSNENVQDDNSHLRALYNTLKEQGLIIEPGELRLEPDLDHSQQLIGESLIQEEDEAVAALPVLQPLSQSQATYDQSQAQPQSQIAVKKTILVCRMQCFAGL